MGFVVCVVGFGWSLQFSLVQTRLSAIVVISILHKVSFNNIGGMIDMNYPVVRLAQFILGLLFFIQMKANSFLSHYNATNPTHNLITII